MCRREFSTASCWYLLISAGSVWLKTAPTGLARLRRVVLHLPVREQRELIELLLAASSGEQVVDAALTLRSVRASNRRSAAGRRRAPTSRRRAPVTATRSGQRRDETGPCETCASSQLRESAFDRAVASRKPHSSVRHREYRRGGAMMLEVRSRLVVALLVLTPVSNGAAASPTPRLRQAHLGVVRRHDGPPSGLPADVLNADGTTSVQTSTTNIGAYMWSAVAAHRLGIISQRELCAGCLGRSRRSSAWSATATPASTTTGTTTARATSSPPGRPTPSTSSTRSCRRSTTAGSRSA